MKLLAHIALAGVLGAAQTGLAYFVPPEENKPTESEKVVTVKAYRVSKLEGMDVKNKAGDELGAINELVLDVEDGKVLYAAVSVGGVLGVGDKLIAVPWKELKIKYDENETYFVVDIDKAKIEAAPGFDQDNWPDVADPKWREDINKYYENAREAARETSAEPQR